MAAAGTGEILLDVGHLDFDRRTLGVLAAVLGACVLLTWFVTSRHQTPQPAALVPVASVMASTGPTATSATTARATATSTPTGEVVVEVVGKVRTPAVVSLPQGSRVQDAVEAAGGAKPGVDTSDQNLARVLVDGEQIRIGLDSARAPVATPGSPGAAGSATSSVNINTAGAVQLEQIPGVGPVLAQRIIAYREQNGGFTSVEQLTEVSGIGEVTFAQMQPMVTVGGGG